MNYTVSCGTLNPTHSLTQKILSNMYNMQIQTSTTSIQKYDTAQKDPKNCSIRSKHISRIY